MVLYWILAHVTRYEGDMGLHSESTEFEYTTTEDDSQVPENATEIYFNEQDCKKSLLENIISEEQYQHAKKAGHCTMNTITNCDGCAKVLLHKQELQKELLV